VERLGGSRTGPLLGPGALLGGVRAHLLWLACLHGPSCTLPRPGGPRERARDHFFFFSTTFFLAPAATTGGAGGGGGAGPAASVRAMPGMPGFFAGTVAPAPPGRPAAAPALPERPAAAAAGRGGGGGRLRTVGRSWARGVVRSGRLLPGGSSP